MKVVTIPPKVYEIICIILQILLILAVLSYIVNLYINLGIKKQHLMYIMIFIYGLYFLFEICSSTSKFLRNKTDQNQIRGIIELLIQTPPVIEFYCECYHYSHGMVYNPPKRKGGRRGGRRHHIRNRRRKIVTYSETAYFPYYSARDVSGLFELKNSRKDAMGKVYIKLELTPEINFADELSYMDYDIFRTNFYDINRRRDVYMNYHERRKVPGLIPQNLVKIRDEEPCGINFCMFFMFTLIGLSEIYKCYVNSFCIDQEFKIRKLISTRYDLNQDQYQYFIPSINVPNQQFAFKPQNYNYINKDFIVKKPTQKEIKNSYQYKDKIPKYECVSYTSINGTIKVGVVNDDPAYCSLNINDAPPPNAIKIDDNNNNQMNINMNGNNFDIDSKNNINSNYNNNIMNLNVNMNMNRNNIKVYNNDEKSEDETD